MLDKQLIILTNYPLELLGKICVFLRISPLAITLANIPITIIIFICILKEFFIVAIILIIINRILDGLDGVVARQTNTNSVRGAYMDLVVDYLFYTAVPLAHGILNPEKNAIATMLILAVFILSGINFIASSSAAHKLDITSSRFPQKNFYYHSNLIEGSETILYVLTITMFPNFFPIISYICASMIIISIPISTIARYKHFSMVEKMHNEENKDNPDKNET